MYYFWQWKETHSDKWALFSMRSLMRDHRQPGTVGKSKIKLILKVHKREKFFGSDFEFFTIL
jgi:hypothetical protein